MTNLANGFSRGDAAGRQRTLLFRFDAGGGGGGGGVGGGGVGAALGAGVGLAPRKENAATTKKKATYRSVNDGSIVCATKSIRQATLVCVDRLRFRSKYRSVNDGSIVCATKSNWQATLVCVDRLHKSPRSFNHQVMEMDQYGIFYWMSMILFLSIEN